MSIHLKLVGFRVPGSYIPFVPNLQTTPRGWVSMPPLRDSEEA